MPRDEALTVLSNAEVAKEIRLLRLRQTAAVADDPAPGRFAMVQVREGASPLLRRPLSYLFAEKHYIEFLYRVVGVGTRILVRARKGDVLNVLGPLGKGFDASLASSRAMLIAGGMGLPPLFYLGLQLKNRIDHVELIHGAATAEQIVLSGAVKDARITQHCATEDGSVGFKGLATELAEQRLKTAPAPDVIYACGPHAMLKAVARLASNNKIPCQVSAEAHMACGVGACMGCAIQAVGDSFLQVCEDGPVFDAASLFPGE